MAEMTEPQAAAVAILERAGWTVNSFDGETVYLSRRDRKIRSMTHYTQVASDGTVN